MASVESAICSELKKDDATLHGLVADRIYKTAVNPDSALGYVAIEMTGGQGHVHHCGGVNTLTHRRGLIHCMAETVSSAESIFDAVRKLLDGTTGTIGSGSNTAVIHRLALDGPIDSLIEPTDGKLGTARRIIPFEVWCTEATS